MYRICAAVYIVGEPDGVVVKTSAFGKTGPRIELLQQPLVQLSYSSKWWLKQSHTEVHFTIRRSRLSDEALYGGSESIASVMPAC